MATGERPKNDAPGERPEEAAKETPAPAKVKCDAREARLAEALRANLRRRKGGPAKAKD